MQLPAEEGRRLYNKATNLAAAASGGCLCLAFAHQVKRHAEEAHHRGPLQRRSGASCIFFLIKFVFSRYLSDRAFQGCEQRKPLRVEFGEVLLLKVELLKAQHLPTSSISRGPESDVKNV